MQTSELISREAREEAAKRAAIVRALTRALEKAETVEQVELAARGIIGDVLEALTAARLGTAETGTGIKVEIWQAAKEITQRTFED